MEGSYFTTKKLCVGYENIPVVSDIEMKIDRGQILSLVGPNGVGKTTVLKTIIGQIPLLAGKIELDGQDMSVTDKKKLAKKMAVVLTNSLQTELMTVEEVVETGRYPYTGRFGILSRHDHEIVEQVMEEVHITNLKEKDFKKISDGQKQKVMLARALAQQPDLLILDEPTSYLDIKHKMEFLSIIKRLAKEEKLTVIMSLHEVELAAGISDKIACFKDGRLNRFGLPEDVFQDNYLLELYDIRLDEMAPEFQKIIMEYF